MHKDLRLLDFELSNGTDTSSDLRKENKPDAKVSENIIGNVYYQPLSIFVFINSPFLWNTIPSKILQISHTKLFRSALRRFLL